MVTVVETTAGCPTAAAGWTKRYTVGTAVRPGVEVACCVVTNRTTWVGAAGEAGGKELIGGATGRTAIIRGGSFNGVRVGIDVEASGVRGAAGVGGGLLGSRPAA